MKRFTMSSDFYPNHGVVPVPSMGPGLWEAAPRHLAIAKYISMQSYVLGVDQQVEQ